MRNLIVDDFKTFFAKSNEHNSTRIKIFQKYIYHLNMLSINSIDLCCIIFIIFSKKFTCSSVWSSILGIQRGVPSALPLYLGSPHGKKVEV